jgi:hypothetical protein
MPKDDAERARPPAHQARTKHPPTHPSRAAQPHRHPDRIKSPHEPPVTMGTDRKDRHESPARKPVRPKATPQPDDGAQQGHDLRLLMKRGLISEKALGRSLPRYAEGGQPDVGQPAVVGDVPGNSYPAWLLRLMGGANAPGYQDGGEPMPGAPALVGEAQDVLRRPVGEQASALMGKLADFKGVLHTLATDPDLKQAFLIALAGLGGGAAGSALQDLGPGASLGLRGMVGAMREGGPASTVGALGGAATDALVRTRQATQ